MRTGIVRAMIGGTLLAAVFAAAACGSESGGGARDSVTIAYQPGLGYAPLLLAKQQRLLEKELPDVKITWRGLNSGSAIRDGVVADEIQLGAMGAGPFLVGWSNGVGWKLITALDNMELQLMVADSKVNDLRDLKKLGADAKIAMPAPDSVQAVVLRKGAQEQLGDPKALDAQIVSMGHPDGVQALAAGQIAAHLTAPPFQEQERRDGARPILSSYDLFGEHTFNSVYAREAFVEDNPETVAAVREVVAEAVEILRDEPERAAESLAAEAGNVPAEDVLQELTANDVEFTTRPLGFGEFAEFSAEIGLIEEAPAEPSELFFDSELTRDGT